MSYHISSGIISSGIILADDTMTIFSGGVANNTTVNSGGDMHISSGGTANSTTVNNYGAIMYISSGGVANSTTMSGGDMFIASGGVANSTTVKSCGTMRIYSGGVANSTTVNYIGYMFISSGGVANSTTMTGGYMTISSGGVANSTTVNYGYMTIFSGGVANSTTMSGGAMYISSGGVANSTTVNSSGDTFIDSGGVANNTTMSGGTMRIYSGGVANSTTVNWGHMYIESGGVANSTTMTGGSMYISSGGVANSTTVNYSGTMHIYSGGTAAEIIENGGYVDIADGADVTFASNTISGLGLIDARMTVHKNTIAESTTVKSRGSMYISSGGVANSTTVDWSGSMHISSGGVANSTTVNYSGTMHIYSGGVATEIVENGGYVGVQDGAEATFASNTISGLVLSNGDMTVHKNTIAESTTVSGGYLYIFSGGVASSTTVNSSGNMCIDSGGVANNTTMSDGVMYISSGGVANSTTVNSDGSMYIFSGGCHKGSLQIENGAVVFAYSGAIIDFTVADRTEEDGYLINDLSRISEVPTYTITVAADQTTGTYKLAQGAGNFKGSISVGDGTVSYGALSVNGTALKYNDTSYQLSLSSGNLNLSVTATPSEPVTPPVEPGKTTPATDIKNRGFSQVIAWDQNRGTVGMIHNDGKSPAAWGGVWEWSGSDVKLWRVAGAGHFKGTKVDYDGVLLYNGIGNTFAAWTDLNDPSYGYVDLCHVEGSFNTRAIADFDGNEYDDILIFDGNGSFGTVLDGTTYKDIWHVDNPASNPWKVLGAGSFGGKEDKLIVENTSNGHLYLWQNNDSSFKTWNWTLTDIGYLGKDSKFMVSGDFNGDGTDDVVIQKSNGEMWCWDDGNSANLRWIGNLDKSFAVESVGDYNADGKEDILLREQNSGWGGLGFWGAGYAGNWTDMNVRIETDTRISGSKFTVIA